MPAKIHTVIGIQILKMLPVLRGQRKWCKSAVAGDLGCHALGYLGKTAGVGENRKIRMSMHINESRNQQFAPAVDHLSATDKRFIAGKNFSIMRNQQFTFAGIAAVSGNQPDVFKVIL